MLEAINAIACAIIFGYCAIVSAIMPGGWRMVGHKVVIWGLTMVLGLQIAAPFSPGISVQELPSVALHLLLAAALVIWRTEAMHFVRCKFVPQDPQATPRRRSTDWGDLPDLTDEVRPLRQVAGTGRRSA